MVQPQIQGHLVRLYSVTDVSKSLLQRDRQRPGKSCQHSLFKPAAPEGSRGTLPLWAAALAMPALTSISGCMCVRPSRDLLLLLPLVCWLNTGPPMGEGKCSSRVKLGKNTRKGICKKALLSGLKDAFTSGRKRFEELLKSHNVAKTLNSITYIIKTRLCAEQARDYNSIRKEARSVPLVMNACHLNPGRFCLHRAQHP